MAENSSKDLLKWEANAANTRSTSGLESKLFFGEKGYSFSLPGSPLEKPIMFPVPKSRVLGKAMDFLGVISESNKKLQEDAKEHPDNFDIEVLSAQQSEYIEMDLMLGVTDLHTPEAVAAAEAAIAGHPPAVPFSEGSSESESEDESEEYHESGSKSAKSVPKDVGGEASCKESREKKRKRRPGIGYALNPDFSFPKIAAPYYAQEHLPLRLETAARDGDTTRSSIKETS